MVDRENRGGLETLVPLGCMCFRVELKRGQPGIKRLECLCINLSSAVKQMTALIKLSSKTKLSKGAA